MNRKFFRDRLVESYLRDIRDARLLDNDELVELFERMEKGDKEAREKLLKSNLRLVVSIAKKFAHDKLAFLDLVQEGNIGLMKSIEKFEHRLGFKFSTFASFWIRQEIIRAIENKGKIIRIPVNVLKHMKRLKKKNDASASACGKDNEEIERISKLEPLSLEDMMDRNTLHFFLVEQGGVEPEEIAIKDIMESEFKKILAFLTPREREVISLRFGFADGIYRTHREVAEMLSISRERVRQLEHQAIERLRKILEDEKLEELFCA